MSAIGGFAFAPSALCYVATSGLAFSACFRRSSVLAQRARSFLTLQFCLRFFKQALVDTELVAIIASDLRETDSSDSVSFHIGHIHSWAASSVVRLLGQSEVHL